MSTRVARSVMYLGSASVYEGMGANLVLTKNSPISRLMTREPKFEIWLHMDNGVVFVSDGDDLPRVWSDLLDLLAEHEDFPQIVSECPWSKRGRQVKGEPYYPRLNPNENGDLRVVKEAKRK